MTRIQIELPDNLFARAQELCETERISMDELIRRSIEHVLSMDARELGTPDDWQLPKPRNLGWKGLTDAELKAEAQRDR